MWLTSFSFVTVMNPASPDSAVGKTAACLATTGTVLFLTHQFN